MYLKVLCQNWETGECVPSINEAVMLARYFNVSVDYLIKCEYRASKNVESAILYLLNELNEDGLSLLMEIAKSLCGVPNFRKHREIV